MQYNTLKAQIVADIYANGNEEITGSILQGDLLAMVNSLASAGAMYGGVITPASAAPADLDQATVYLALTAGTYTNFVDSGGNPIVTAGPALITYDGGASLVFAKTDLPSGGSGATIVINDGTDGDAVAIILTDNQSYKRSYRIDMTAEYTGGTNEQRIGSLIIECYSDATDDICHGYYYGDEMSDILTEVAVYQDDIDPDTFYLMLTHESSLDSVTFAISPTDGGEVDAIITNASDDHTKVDDANISPVGSGSSDAVLYTPQTLTAAQKKQARTNIDSEYSGKLIYDHTYNLYSEALIPTAYDSGTGYYTVASFPSWVTVGNGEDFYGILNVTDFSTANAVPFPDANSQSNVKLTKIDSTHFSVKTTAPAGTPNPNAFYFTNPGLYLSIPRGTGNVRYRVVIENGATIVSRYLTIIINGHESLYLGGIMPFGTYALGYRAEKPLQADIEMEFSIDFTQTPPKLTAHAVRSSAIVKSNATTFTYLTMPKAYGDVTGNLWQGTPLTDYFYIHGQNANITFIHDGTRVRVYILED